MIRVYHFPESVMRDILFMPRDEIVPFVRQHLPNYKHVADINTDSLDVAWEATQSIDRHWSTNSRVTQAYGTSLRSSCVGDVFETETKKFIVVSVGFVELK